MSGAVAGGDLQPIASPYRIDGGGRTAEAAPDAHLRALMEMVLFTSPGERVMRPSFGSGVLNLVFAPNSQELAATTQMLIMGALQMWLGALIDVNSIAVDTEDSTLTITISYIDRRSGDLASVVFGRSV
ncbi:MAG TPA: GPW/gp25 family protein [Rhodopila sp.]